MEHLLGAVSLIGSILAVIIMARFFFGLTAKLEGYSLTTEVVRKDNKAVGLRFAFFLLAVVISFLGVLHPSGISWKEDLNLVAKYSLLVIVLLYISQKINDRLILYGFPNNREVVGEQNAAVALVEGATYLATAFIMTGAVDDWEGGFLMSLAWFAIGQAFLVILAFVYRLVVPQVFSELDNHNTASALSLGGFLLAGGMALGLAVSGPSNGWLVDLKEVGLQVGIWLAFVSVAQFALNRLLLPSARIRDEIIVDKNIAAGAINAALIIGVTIFFNKVW